MDSALLHWIVVHDSVVDIIVSGVRNVDDISAGVNSLFGSGFLTTGVYVRRGFDRPGQDCDRNRDIWKGGM